MSVAALPPPSQLHDSLLAQPKRQVTMPRPATSTSSIASRPVAQVKARPTQPTPTISRRPSSTASSTPRSTPATLPPAAALNSSSTPSSSKDTSSSSGKVFAKPSKEWVLPERAKPGRKVSVEEPDNKRQSQNRLSQRAHRARRTDYITTLEERLRQYEADEIHSNVRLQEVARALKADNERLKKEVISLRMDVNDLQSQRDSWEAERANYEQVVVRLNTQLNDLRGGVSSPPHFTRPTYTQRPVPVMPTIVPNTDRRATMDCPICPDPDPDCPCQQRDQAPTLPAVQPTTPLAALHLAVKAMAEQHPDPTPGGDPSCGVCQTHEECLCRVISDMDDAEDVKPVIPPSPSPEISLGVSLDDGCGLCTSASFCACKATASSHGSSQSPMVTVTTLSTTMSTAAVPLRLGRSRTKVAPIWALDPPSAAMSPKKNDDAVCSGDPSNCEACRDDRFGQEFCSNLFDTAEPAIPGQPAETITPVSHYQPTSLSEVTTDRNAPHETMTADKAWKALKAHPNSKFASLSLLADVVSGRTMSTSAVRGEPSPAPSPVLAPAGKDRRGEGTGMGVGSKKRSMAVETSAVRDALRLLDVTSAPSSPAISATGRGPVGKEGQSERDMKKRKLE